MICKSKGCKKETMVRSKFCSLKCRDKNYYQTHTKEYKKSARAWESNNRERAREIARKANTKFRTEKRDRFNQLMRESYYRNKDKWNSRKITRLVILQPQKPVKIKKLCKTCHSKNDLSLKFETYPIKAADIRKAIKEQRIYYMCRKCRRKLK